MEKNKIIHNHEKSDLQRVALALSTPLRLEIMNELAGASMSIKEIAFKLNVPTSTVSANIKILEEADLVRTSYQPGKHGSLKLCSIKYEKMIVELMGVHSSEENDVYRVDMPIGSFFDFNVSPTCGLVDENDYIGRDDDVCTFYSAERFRAQLIWFYSGHLEYRFPLDIEYDKIVNIQFSLEVCSEAPGYRNVFPSDITFWINDREICEWTSPGDYGGTHGLYTPDWWPNTSTQYGILKKITVSDAGSFLDDAYVGNVTLKKLELEGRQYVSFRVGVKPTAHNVGGINIFGEKFGNHAQNIVMHVEYVAKGEHKE